MKRTNKITAIILSAIIMVSVTMIGVLSANAGAKIDSAVSWAVSIANNNTYGYSQSNRWGPDYDCSSFVISAFQQAGVPVKTNGASYTGDMYSVFISTGFSNVTSQITLSSGSGLQKGDVLLKPDGHTALVSAVSGSSVTIVHASQDTDGKTGDSKGNEILTRTYYNHPWTYVLRYNESSATTAPATSYYPKYTGSSTSLVDALNAVGADSSYANREKIAAKNGISGYTGTATQNTQLLNLLKAGTLKKP